MKRFDERSASCLVFTYKEGLLSPLAHDLQIRVGRFTVEVADDGGAIEARFDAASLVVVCAMIDGRAATTTLSARDRRTIETNLEREVLRAHRHPHIEFRSTAVARDGDTATVQGALTLHGRTRELTLAALRSGGRWGAEVRLFQPDFGITPYSALLGTLRIQPHLTVRLSLPGDLTT